MRYLLNILLLTFFLSSASCTSYFKRKECEATNWFEHGEKIAMQGRRTSGDSFLHECKKVGADIREADLDRGFKKGMNTYCTPTEAYKTGKGGDFFGEELCDGPGIREMKRQHLLGVKDYCQVTNGHRAGTLGKKYNGICSKDGEAAFLKEFNRGRKQYLEGQIQAKNLQIQSLNEQIGSNETRRRSLNLQLATLPPATRVERAYVKDPASGAQRVEERTIEDTSAKHRRDDLANQLRRIDSETDDQQKQASSLKNQVAEMIAEVATLQ